jgi:hypothetical protein
MATAETTPKREIAEEILARLKAILGLYAARMVVVHDTPTGYYLDTRHVMKNKKPLFFAAATIGKSYVSFHLFPVYTCPTLLDGLSEGLRARMQGKACFNFKRVDAALFEELAALTQAGFERFQSPELIESFCGGSKR